MRIYLKPLSLVLYYINDETSSSNVTPLFWVSFRTDRVFYQVRQADLCSGLLVRSQITVRCETPEKSLRRKFLRQAEASTSNLLITSRSVSSFRSVMLRTHAQEDHIGPFYWKRRASTAGLKQIFGWTRRELAYTTSKLPLGILRRFGGGSECGRQSGVHLRLHPSPT